jgi:hypothetical protein
MQFSVASILATYFYSSGNYMAPSGIGNAKAFLSGGASEISKAKTLGYRICSIYPRPVQIEVQRRRVFLKYRCSWVFISGAFLDVTL